MDAEVRRIIVEAYKTTEKLLQDNKDKLITVCMITTCIIYLSGFHNFLDTVSIITKYYSLLLDECLVLFYYSTWNYVNLLKYLINFLS